MSEPAGPTKNRPRYVPVVRIGLLLAVILLILYRLLAADERPLKPLRPIAAPGVFEEENGQPLLFGFNSLHDDPFAMRDRRLRMTGSFTRVEALDCLPLKGPAIEWALVAEDLQMNATGYEVLLASLPVGTTLTVDGVWRLHEGPLGCGKAPPVQSIWYLEVEQIVQPNPLFGQDGVVVLPTSIAAGASAIGESATPAADDGVGNGDPDGLGSTPTPSATPSPMPAVTGTVISSPPAGSLSTITPTATNGANGTATPVQTGTPTPTVTPTVTTPAGQPTQPGATATSSAPIGGSSTSTPFPTIPPFQTATPGDGYPGPAATVTATGTPDSYP